jgi:glucuronate isomerase
MQQFMTEDFLLHGSSAWKLYCEHAAEMPIYDYHCHLPPSEIAEDRRFANMSEIWLAGDHYKWRAMRTNGVPESLITGDATDREKFQAWAETVPATVGNPLYHWTHMEMARPFGITDVVLNGDSAQDVWDRTESKLAEPAMSARGIITRMNVRLICTTDDPTDDLAYHRTIAADATFGTKVLPTFRPDKAFHIEASDTFRTFAQKLEEVTGKSLSTYDDFLGALLARVEFFHEAGCRISDHALQVPVFSSAPGSTLQSTYRKVRDGADPSQEEARQFATETLLALGRAYAAHGWAMQLHIGALRNNNLRMHALVGPDSGFDSIADEPIAIPLNLLLATLDRTSELPRTVLYTLNAGYNDTIATTIGNYQDGSMPGKMQFGSGWWFQDQKHGMRQQMTTLANMGLLSRFVGMLTDSRSFLSYTRHDYFRRVLCDLIGSWVDAGEAPRDFDLLGSMVEDICWNNARNYFGIELTEA